MIQGNNTKPSFTQLLKLLFRDDKTVTYFHPLSYYVRSDECKLK